LEEQGEMDFMDVVEVEQVALHRLRETKQEMAVMD
jgi:hypothetical protein